MNKTELIKLLRDPSKLSNDNLKELEDLINDSPYFLSARLLLAKGSKELKHPQTKKRISSAAVYSTDRILLKKYLSSELFFLSRPPAPENMDASAGSTNTEVKTSSSKPESDPIDKAQKDGLIPKREDKRPSPLKAIDKKPSPKVPEVPSAHLDSILEELQKDMENLKASREHFIEVQDKIVNGDPPATDVDKEFIKEEKADKEDKAFASIGEKIIEETPEEKVEINESDEAKSDELNSNEDEIISQKIAELTAAVSAAKERDSKKEVEEESREEEEESASERAERAIKEPRFSRFSTRSYLANDEEQEEDQNERIKLEPIQSKKEENEIAKEKPKKSISKKAKSEEKNDPTKKVDKKKTTQPKKVEEVTKATIESKKTSVSEKQKAKSATKKVLPEESQATKAEKGIIKVEKEIIKAEKEVVKAEKEIIKVEKEVLKKEENKAVTAKKESKKEEPIQDKKVTPPISSFMPKAKAVVRKNPRKSKKTPTQDSTSESTSKKSSSKGKSGEGQAEEKKDDGKADRDLQHKIIEKFIEESPTIKYKRTAEASASDLAESSAAWDPNLASEYLAEIYLNQGNKKRAIEIYEALSLKYPEKKSYFADLISKIE